MKPGIVVFGKLAGLVGVLGCLHWTWVTQVDARGWPLVGVAQSPSPDPASTIVSVVLLCGLAAAWYLALIALVNAALRWSVDDAKLGWLDRFTPAVVRRLFVTRHLAAVAATGLGVVGFAAPSGASAQNAVFRDTAHDVLDTAVMHRLDQAPSVGDADTPGNRVPTPRSDSATMHRARFDAWRFQDLRPNGSATEGRTGVAAAAEEHVWLTQPGDHFWTIAHESLAEAWGVVPSEAQVASYWRLLVDANADRLVSPANPDLIYPGQEFWLPPIQAEPH